MNAEVYPSKDGWRFRVRGDNGEIMCVGESYVRRIDAEHALQTLFAIGQRIDVTVRNHHKEVVDHYAVGVAPAQPEPAADPELTFDRPEEGETDA